MPGPSSSMAPFTFGYWLTSSGLLNTRSSWATLPSLRMLRVTWPAATVAGMLTLNSLSETVTGPAAGATGATAADWSVAVDDATGAAVLVRVTRKKAATRPIAPSTIRPMAAHACWVPPRRSGSRPLVSVPDGLLPMLVDSDGAVMAFSCPLLWHDPGSIVGGDARLQMCRSHRVQGAGRPPPPGRSLAAGIS